MALNIVRVRIFWTSNIFVIIVFPYTHDTGAVTGTEPGVEFYTLPLIEIQWRLNLRLHKVHMMCTWGARHL